MAADPLDPDVRRLVDQAIAQGLPEFVEDEAVIARVAAIVGAARTAPPDAA